MIKLTTEIVPGKIMYHVNGSAKNMTKTGDYERFIIVSKPYDIKFTFKDAPFFNIICEYINFDGKIDSYSFKRSCNDMGIFKPGEQRSRSVYNLNRSFWTREEAEQFIVELQTGNFSDPDDQKYYDNCDKVDYYDEY